MLAVRVVVLPPYVTVRDAVLPPYVSTLGAVTVRPARVLPCGAPAVSCALWRSLCLSSCRAPNPWPCVRAIAGGAPPSCPSPVAVLSVVACGRAGAALCAVSVHRAAPSPVVPANRTRRTYLGVAASRAPLSHRAVVARLWRGSLDSPQSVFLTLVYFYCTSKLALVPCPHTVCGPRILYAVPHTVCGPRILYAGSAYWM